MELQFTEQKQQTIKGLINSDAVQKKFTEILGKRANAFLTSVLQIVNSNEMLKNADPLSVYNSAALAAVLDLPLNNTLGFSYIVPYNRKQKDGSYRVVAEFMVGYKGFIQLAQRSGQFKTISATRVYEGNIVSNNPLTGIEFDFNNKISDKVIGYASYFKLLNGFEKTFYMSVEELKEHGKKYSKTFENKGGIWNTDFESMAIKTVIKLILSKYAPLSVEMQKAIISDQSDIKDYESLDVEYVDNDEVEVDKESERVRLFIENAKTKEDLKSIKPHIKDEHIELYKQKEKELKN